MAGTCLVMRLAMARDLYSHKTHLLPTHLRIGALWFGVLLSYWYHFRQEDLGRLVTKRRLLLLVAGLVLVVPCFLVAIETSVYVYTIGLTASYAGWGCVLLAAVYWQPGQLRWTRWIWALLAAIGFYSYSIYLWHVFARRMVVTALLGFSDRGVALPHALELLLYVVAALLIGTLMARTIESPFLRLRDHWFPSRGKALEFAQPKR
jgi:peptidoglycan/LPS O-acetylase OafA/YrhL